MRLRDSHLDAAIEKFLEKPELLAASVDLAGFGGVLIEIAGDVQPPAGQREYESGGFDGSAVQGIGGTQERQDGSEHVAIVA